MEGGLAVGTEALYVSPLKALSNDIHKNLESPLEELSALAESKAIQLAPIRTAVRTGDTGQAERQSMIRKPPHILVTPPSRSTSCSRRSRVAGSRARCVPSSWTRSTPWEDGRFCEGPRQSSRGKLERGKALILW